MSVNIQINQKNRNMKFLITAAFLCISAAPALAESIPPSFFALLPQSGTGNVGDILSFDAVLVPFADVFGYNVDVVFPTFLTFIDADEEGYFLANGIGVSWDTPTGPAVVNNINDLIAGPDGFTASDDILRLNFLVTGAGAGTIEFFDESLVDDNFNFLPVDPTAPEAVQTQDAPAGAPEPATFFSMVPALIAGFFLRKRIVATKS
jgi:hypothetical protein